MSRYDYLRQEWHTLSGRRSLKRGEVRGGGTVYGKVEIMASLSLLCDAQTLLPLICSCSVSRDLMIDPLRYKLNSRL